MPGDGIIGHVVFVWANLLIFVVSTALFGLVAAVVGLWSGLMPLGAHSVLDLLLGSMLAPVFMLLGHGIAIAIAVTVIVDLLTPRVPSFIAGRALAILLAGLGGAAWLVLFLGAELEHELTVHGLLSAIGFWAVFGAAMWIHSPGAESGL